MPAVGVRVVAVGTLPLVEDDVGHQADRQALVHQLRDVPDVAPLSEAAVMDPTHAARTAVDQAPSET